MLEQLKQYYNQLNNEHKQLRNKYKKVKPGSSGFHYDKNQQWSDIDKKTFKNIKEQKLHIKRLIKLIEEK